MAEVILENLSKAFGKQKAVVDMNMTIENGSFVVLLGPTGAGKTTTLRLISGLEKLDSGCIKIDGRIVNDEIPAQRDVAMVFQAYSLYPHLTVRNNLAFPLRSPILNTSKDEVERKVNEVAEILQITHKLDNRATELSGGEMQRVSIGRALVRDPAIFLMDEPLSSLDARLRADLRIELKRIHYDLGSTLLYVTHDQVEAMTMADKIVVLQAGVIEQVGSPMDLYREPANVFVAGFIGSPAMNLIEGPEAKSRGAKTIGVRPEHFSLSMEGGEWRGLVGVSEHLGSDTFLRVEVEGIGTLTARADGEFPARHGDTVGLTPDPERIHRFDEAGLRISS